MLSKSLGAARTAVRDLFRSADHRRNREHCWADAADEWGAVNTARGPAATPTRAPGNASWTTLKDVGLLTSEVASEDTFYTSQSWQTNLTDVPAPSTDNAIIKDGPRRHVPSPRSGPAVEETYLVLDRVSACLERGADLGKADRSSHAAQEDCSHGSHMGVRTDEDGPGEEVCDGGEKQVRAAASAEDVRIPASTLFAYRAMTTREGGHGDAARLYAKMALQTKRTPCSETETRDQHVLSQRILFQSNGPQSECPHPWTTQDAGALGRDVMHDSRRKAAQDGARDAAAVAFADEYDISDDEGDSSGRISPRTFRLWATGLSSREVGSGRENAEFSVYMGSSDDGAASSSAESSLEDDDSSWSSNWESLAPSKWNRILSWQNKMPNPRPENPSFSPSRLPGQVITLKNTDILSALSHPSAPPLLAHVPLSHIHSALHLRHQLLLDSRQAETHLAGVKSEVQVRIDHLLCTTQEDTPPTRAQTAQPDREQQYREEIYRHVEGHLGDVAGLYLASQDRVRALAEEVDGLVARERMLRARLER
ncbi:hypothetical protein E4U55_001128 [Claviceps digitariae]|nr:hypothetical protein E4U55_001128 [Claviceps digitariae]